MDYHVRPAVQRSLRMRRPPARYVDCMIQERVPLPPPSLTAVVSDHQTQMENPCSSSMQHEQSQNDICDIDVKEEILGLKGMLVELMFKMSHLVVSSKHSELSESFDDYDDDDDAYNENDVDNTFVNTTVVQKLCACIKKAEQKSARECGNSSTAPMLLPSSRCSSLPLPLSSLIRSPPQHTSITDTPQPQSGSMMQSIMVPNPSNCPSPQVQTPQVHHGGSPQQTSHVPGSSFSQPLVHTHSFPQVTTVQRPTLLQYAVSQYSQPIGPPIPTLPIPNPSSANTSSHIQPQSVHQGISLHSKLFIIFHQPPLLLSQLQLYYVTLIPSHIVHLTQFLLILLLVFKGFFSAFWLMMTCRNLQCCSWLTNLLSLHDSEHYKYHILLDHLKFSPAHDLDLAYANDPRPYSMALWALQKKYGQTHQLV